MKRSIYINIFTLLILSTNIIFSQEEVKPEIKIGGQVRYRGELDLRFFDFNEKPLFINMFRTRLNANVIINQNISTFIQFQDSRNFGEENSRSWRGTLDGSADNLDLHQGYIELKDLGLDNFSLKFGRMMFGTNNERVVGSLDWHNIGRSYDGAVANYNFNNWQVRGFGFLLGTNELLMTSGVQQVPKMLVGIDLNIPFVPAGNVYFYHDKNERASQVPSAGAYSSLPKLSRYTVGFFTKSESKGLIWELETATQFGTIDTLPRLTKNSTNNINAWLLSAFAGYKESNFSIGGGLDMYSGDNPETDEFEGFDHIFITLHKFYGYMDFFPFTVLPNGGLRQSPEGTNKGLLMPNLKAVWEPDQRWKLELSLLSFRTMEPYKFEGDELFTLGTEIDLLAFCKIAKGVNAQFGSSIFIPGTILEKTNPSKGMGTDPAYWGYTMIMVDF